MASRKRFLPKLVAKKAAAPEAPASSNVSATAQDSVAAALGVEKSSGTSAAVQPVVGDDSRGSAPTTRPVTTTVAEPSSLPTSECNGTSVSSLDRHADPTPSSTSSLAARAAEPSPSFGSPGPSSQSSLMTVGGFGMDCGSVSAPSVPSTPPVPTRTPASAVPESTAPSSQPAVSGGGDDDTVFVAANVDVASSKGRGRKRSSATQSVSSASSATTTATTTTTTTTTTTATTTPGSAKSPRAGRRGKSTANSATSSGSTSTEPASESPATDGQAGGKKSGAKKKPKGEPKGVLTEAPEPTKVRMRDLVRLNPVANPMTPPVSLSSEKSVSSSADAGAVVAAAESNPPAPSEPPPSANMAPQVCVAEDGSIVIDESSLVVRTTASEKALVEDREVVYEQASTATYSSFKKRDKIDRWTAKETEKFYDILQQVGTDFSMMAPAFPTKTRRQLKNKFKKEERSFPGKVSYSLRQRKPVNLEMFKRPPPPEPETPETPEASASVTKETCDSTTASTSAESAAPGKDAASPSEASLPNAQPESAAEAESNATGGVLPDSAAGFCFPI